GLGLPPSWLEDLPSRLGVDHVGVTVRDVQRSGVICKQVQFSIPEQPQGRHVGDLIRLVERAKVSDRVKERAIRAFRLLGEAEGKEHGAAPEKVHLHEDGSVDAVHDIAGAVDVFDHYENEAVYNYQVTVGRGWLVAQPS